ncbi:Cas4 family exonuclease [Gordonia phage GiKK]|nr:Cas4 family exonuclease [Gordonia phage GiKK]
MSSSEITVTNSLIKSFKGCQQATKYKHVERIGPKLNTAQPLTRGTWFHEMLEAYYLGKSVTDVHKREIAKYGKLTDEEKDALGDLPRDMARLFKGYRWHYRDDKSWTVHDAEIKLEADLPSGLQAQGKADMIVEDEYGLWLVDHKTHKSLPRTEYRLLDFQSKLYIWMARKCGIPVLGFIWNYIVPKAPEPLKFNQNGDLSKRQPHTDYPTALRSAQEHDALQDPGVIAILTLLEQQRYQRDVVQSSPVFRRDLLEFDDATIDRVIADIDHTAQRYADWRERLALDPEAIVERSVSRGCDWCAYRTLCVAELAGNDADGIRRREFTQHDPFAYYEGSDAK